MEYKKEGEKFAFGVGVDKVAGAGKVSDAVPLTDKKSDDKGSLIKIAASFAADVAKFILNFARGTKKGKSGKGKKRK